MGFISALYETGKALEASKDADFLEGLLFYHMPSNIAFDICISAQGEFISAGRHLDKKKVMIPCTMQSSARSSDKSPHPLFDDLTYVCDSKSLCAYIWKDKPGKDPNKDLKDAMNPKYDDMCARHTNYLENLRGWAYSKFGTHNLKAVYRYLESGTLLKDMINCGAVHCSEITNADGKAIIYASVKSMMGFCIIEDGIVNALYECSETRESYIRYYESKVKSLKNSVTDAFGNTGEYCVKHPAKCWPYASKAKLISMNEKPNRGFIITGERFHNAEDIASVTWENSQLIHHTLRWLINRNGFTDGYPNKTFGNKLFLIWGLKSGMDLSPIYADTTSFIRTVSPDNVTDVDFSKAIRKAIRGIEDILLPDEKIAAAVIECPTQGRMSLTFYQEFAAAEQSELIANIQKWHDIYKWSFMEKVIEQEGNNKSKATYTETLKTPSVYEIATYAFGSCRNGFMRIENSNASIISNAASTLISCLINGRTVPYQISEAIFRKTRNPMGCGPHVWSHAMRICCALYKERFKEAGTLMPNTENKDAVYNLGRWLACAHHLESLALFIKKESRETAAIRNYSKFMDNPMRYMMFIERKLKPYEIYLGGRGAYIRREMQAITQNIDKTPHSELKKLRNLDARAVLGYESEGRYLRKLAFDIKTNKTSESIKEN